MNTEELKKDIMKLLGGTVEDLSREDYRDLLEELISDLKTLKNAVEEELELEN